MKYLYMFLFFISFFFLIGCISRNDLYGNWRFSSNSPTVYAITPSYRFFASSPSRSPHKESICAKQDYKVDNYIFLLRLKTENSIDNVFNIFGFKFMDNTIYWLGFIPIKGFKFSYKISDEEMLKYLEIYSIKYDDIFIMPVYSLDHEYHQDRSVPEIMEKLKK